MLGKQRASLARYSDLGDSQTDADGRCGSLMAPGTLTPGLIVVVEIEAGHRANLAYRSIPHGFQYRGLLHVHWHPRLLPLRSGE